MLKPHLLRFRVISLAVVASGALAFGLLSSGCAKQTRSTAEDEAEAQRLYERADVYVRRINEGAYSYEYINFHYDQTMKNIDRILTAYPNTTAGRKLEHGDLKLGDFTIDYFRNTVLPQLGDMKEATESVVNCAIYLHNLPEASRPETKVALGQILETLCRLVRADEAMIFPTLEEDRLFARETIVRVIASDVQQGSLSLVQGADPAEQPALAAAYGEGLAASGGKLEDLEQFAQSYPTPGKQVEAGILRGMVERESNIYRDGFDKVKKKREEEARQEALKSGKANDKPAEESVRYDVAGYFQQKFGGSPPSVAANALANYKALQGTIDDARTLIAKGDEAALIGVLDNYFEYLSLTGKLTGRETLQREAGLSADGVAHCQMKLVELLAANARYAEADALKESGTAEFPKFHDQYIRSRMRGVFYSREELFRLDAKTIPALDIKDPAICAQVLLDWFLSPNRLLKGSSWGADQILFKYFSMQKEGRAISRKQIKVK